MSEGKTLEVDHEFFIRASPEKVFEAISTARGLVSWMVARAVLPTKTGASYKLEFQGGWRHQGTVHRYQAGRSISLNWSWEGVSLKGSILSLSVRPKQGGALFRYVHRGFTREERWMDLVRTTEWGWTYYGMNLKSVLESGHDLRSGWDS